MIKLPEITAEQLKKLADFGGVEIRNIIGTGFICNEKNLGDVDWNYDFWQPHLDSNQLDLLEDKMIESEIGEMEIYFYDDNVEVVYYGSEGILGYGKTKNEARLNAIINYVEGITK